MPPSEQILASGRGYRILKSDRLVFERPADGAPLVAWIGLGVSFLAGLVALGLVARAASNASERGDLIGGVLILVALAVVSFIVGRRALRRTLRARERAGPRLILDDSSLRNEQGDELAPRGKVRLRTNIDFTDGMGGFRWARVLSLCWPDAGLPRSLPMSVPIFRTYDKGELHKLRQALAALGINDAD
jgi:hypothetical protein